MELCVGGWPRMRPVACGACSAGCTVARARDSCRPMQQAVTAMPTMRNVKWHAAVVQATAGLVKLPELAISPTTESVVAGTALFHPPREHEHAIPRHQANRVRQMTSSSDLGLDMPTTSIAVPERNIRAVMDDGANEQLPGTKGTGTSCRSDAVRGGQIATKASATTPKAVILRERRGLLG